MTYNQLDPQVHHRFIPHKVIQYGVDYILTRVSKLLAIFFMQLVGNGINCFATGGAGPKVVIKLQMSRNHR